MPDVLVMEIPINESYDELLLLFEKQQVYFQFSIFLDSKTNPLDTLRLFWIITRSTKYTWIVRLNVSTARLSLLFAFRVINLWMNKRRTTTKVNNFFYEKKNWFFFGCNKNVGKHGVTSSKQWWMFIKTNWCWMGERGVNNGRTRIQ